MSATLLKSAAAVLAVGALTATVWAVVPGGAPPKVPVSPAVPPAEPAAAPVPKEAGKAEDGVADSRQRMRSMNNLKQIMIGLHNYHDAVGHFPNDITDKNGKALLSWRVAVLPYMEQEQLYKQFKLDESWDSDNNKKLLAKMPDVFRVGIEEKGSVKTFYQGIAGPGTAFEPGQKLKLVSVTDGTSNTLGVVEAGPAVEWTKPADISYDPRKAFPKFDGPFRNVVAVATLDGAAYTLKPDLKDQVLHDLTTRAGGEIVDLDKAKAESKAFSKEDKELALKLQQENTELARERAALLAEWSKLAAELAKNPGNPGPDLDKLMTQQLELRRELEALKAEIEALKKALEKK